MPDLLASLQDILGDRYQLEGELGHGGMATVYRARDRKLSRAVAIKVLPPEYALVVGSDRFQREIAIASALQHPNIVPLYDSGGSGDLLYYIMPLVGGETLRERLERETQLPVEDALRIAREVADALGYAHAQGFVHRDIKPENILLASGKAMVADFGIAKAITEIGGRRLTERHLAIGTPEYMSPEQASGADQIDGRSDEYSLACVLFEMLAGDPPFKGRTAQAILAKQMQERPPSLQVVRPTVSLEFQKVLETALAKVPADRYPTATRFVESLAAAPAIHVPAKRRRLGRASIGSAAAIVIVIALLWYRSGFVIGPRSLEATLDTSHYAVLPFERDPGVTGPSSEDQLLRDALARRWSGIIVVDQFLVRDAAARVGGPLTSRNAQRIALQLGAGRYVRGSISRLGDSLRLQAGLYDASRDGAILQQASAWLPVDLRGADVALATLADSLLAPGAGPGAHEAANSATRSLPALQAFVRGHEAIQQWDLDAADSAFAGATRFDEAYSAAYLWLAQVRLWRGRRVATWQSAAERAAAGHASLSPRDSALSDALLATAHGDAVRACSIWRSLTRRDRFDFVSWFGLGSGLSADSAVVTDAASPSGWSFRTSYQEAITAYERAFQLLPSMHRALRDRSFLSVRRLFKTSRNAKRPGLALPPDTTKFLAYPSLKSDTLAFVPYPEREILARSARSPQATTAAIDHERARFRRIALEWVTAFPHSPDALEALALSMEMLGDTAALDTLRHARGFARTAEDSVRVEAAEVWMRVRLSVPDNLAGARTAQALADSILREFPPGHSPEPLILASVAALAGRASLAAMYSREPAATAEFGIPAPLAGLAFPLLTFSALGGSLDSIRVLEARVDSAIQRQPASAQPDLRAGWLARPATLVFPEYRFRSWRTLLGLGDFVFDAQAAFIAGDTAAVRPVIRRLQSYRQRIPGADVTFDGLYSEARLLDGLDGARAAIDWMDPTLTTISATEPYALSNPARAGAFVRCVVLRADLAARVSDPAAAARWARAVVALWSNADAFAEPTLARMRQLAR